MARCHALLRHSLSPLFFIARTFIIAAATADFSFSQDATLRLPRLMLPSPILLIFIAAYFFFFFFITFALFHFAALLITLLYFATVITLSFISLCLSPLLRQRCFICLICCC